MVIISVPKLLRNIPGGEGSDTLIDTLNKPQEKTIFF